MATKFFGYSRADAYKPDFALKDTDFTSYDPSKLLTSVEMTEERPPLQWWPTENDLASIRGHSDQRGALAREALADDRPARHGRPERFPGGQGQQTTTTASATTTSAPPAVSFTPPAGQAP